MTCDSWAHDRCARFSEFCACSNWKLDIDDTDVITSADWCDVLSVIALYAIIYA
jgi:hypothetical protein